MNLEGYLQDDYYIVRDMVDSIQSNPVVISFRWKQA